MSRSFLVAALLVIALAAVCLAQCGPGGSRPYPPGQTVCPPAPPMSGMGGPGRVGPGGMPGGMGGMPGGMGMTSGSSASTLCPASTSTSCARDGSSNFHKATLSYDRSTGIFSGSIITNQCPEHAYGEQMGVMSGGHLASASCIMQEFPAPSFRTFPAAAPLRGRVGLSLSGGVNIYGPLEAGFSAGQACYRGYGSCPAGVDLATCEAELEQECGTRNVDYGMLLDTCGGHAIPYHYHTDLACNYAKNAIGGAHSPLVGIALDGRGIYGAWERDGQPPTDLDACNGHFGPVPERVIDGVVYPAADNVYHYHTTEDAPFTIGCFGPVTSLAQCLSLYPSCNTGFSDICTSKGSIHYDTDCPCYRHGADTYNSIFNPAAPDCTPCEGACTGTKLSPTQAVQQPAGRPQRP